MGAHLLQTVPRAKLEPNKLADLQDLARVLLAIFPTPLLRHAPFASQTVKLAQEEAVSTVSPVNPTPPCREQHPAPVFAMMDTGTMPALALCATPHASSAV